jgi:sporulation protein YlmC with PRC-barrel domain
MRINTKQFFGLPVETEGGAPVGKASSADFETESGRMTELHVKTRGVIPGLMNEELMIGWSQIVEITAERVVVADASVPEGARAFADASRGVAMGGAQFSERTSE